LIAFTVSLAFSLASYFSSYFFKAFSTAFLASLPAFFPAASAPSLADSFLASQEDSLAAAGHAAGAGILTTLTFGSSSSSAIALRTFFNFPPP